MNTGDTNEIAAVTECRCRVIGIRASYSGGSGSNRGPEAVCPD